MLIAVIGHADDCANPNQAVRVVMRFVVHRLEEGMMMRTFVLGLIAVFVLAGIRAEASPVIVNFSFTNAGGGTVAGIVLGLVDGLANQQATSVQVTSNTGTGGFGIGEYVGIPTFDLWSVAGGQITAVNFLVFGVSNDAPAVTSASLAFQSLNPGEGRFGLSNSANSVTFNDAVKLSDTFTVAPVPASLPLVAAALGGLGLIARRRRVA